MSSDGRTILVANRGEIAVRILRTCRRMGFRTVAVASEADRNAPHVAAADEWVEIGPAAPLESYLRVDRILDAAAATGATDVHPGYGFLSENAGFARAVVAAGLRFVGPPASVVETMGSKLTARVAAESAGVHGLPSAAGDDAALCEAAEAFGFPVLVKAVSGGGGKGMRRVDDPAALPDALAACRREAAAAFDDNRLLVERYIEGARHLEVQLIADSHGNIRTLFDRDCSLQRRSQKVMEECPAPGIGDLVRRELIESATAVAAAVGYQNAGTVEFLWNPSGELHFLEMNTRLQVEHTVTEMVTGLDLVEWQLRVAAGEQLPQELVPEEPMGHAIEARLYAEDPMNGFLPSTGRIDKLVLPEGPGIRVDSGIAEGLDVTSWYDPLLAKIVAVGSDRDSALDCLGAALEKTRLIGLRTNLELLRSLTTDAGFRAGGVDTGYLGEMAREWALQGARSATHEELIAAAAALWLGESGGTSVPLKPRQDAPSPWATLGPWRLGARDLS
jgi:3-methylcrotonyl-CoA carboxylase alpha subunit